MSLCPPQIICSSHLGLGGCSVSSVVHGEQGCRVSGVLWVSPLALGHMQLGPLSFLYSAAVGLHPPDPALLPPMSFLLEFLLWMMGTCVPCSRKQACCISPSLSSFSTLKASLSALLELSMGPRNGIPLALFPYHLLWAPFHGDFAFSP